MGGPTKAQKARAVRAVEPVKDPEQGVYISRMKDEDVPEDERKLLAFKGPFECQMTPQGALAILEMVPDLGNKNKGLPIPTIRRFIAAGVWAEVVIK